MSQKPINNEQIVSYFKTLSPRDKLLLNAFDDVCTMGGECCGKDKIDQRVRTAIQLDNEDVPADNECQMLHYVSLAARLEYADEPVKRGLRPVVESVVQEAGLRALGLIQ